MLLHFLVVIIITLFVVFFGYLKVYHRFWYLQPCFHFYDVLKYVQSPHVIYQQPIESSYINNTNIKTIAFKNATSLQLQEFITLIRKHFLRNKTNQYVPDLLVNILPFFSSENSFLSIYEEKRVLLDKKTDTCIRDKVCTGVMTSSAIEIQSRNTTLQAFYVDYLCVHKKHRKKGIAEQLIQTHERNQRNFCPTIPVSLFKREGSLNFLVPLCVYKSYLKKVKEISESKNSFSVELTPFRDLFEFLKTYASMFHVYITYPIGTLIELIKTKNMYVISLLDDQDTIVALYFFKDSCTYTNNERLLSCIGSIRTSYITPSDFRLGFDIAISKFFLPTFHSSIVIESTSHNTLLKSDDDIYFMTMAFFFYNYVCGTVLPSKFLSLI
jgi:predicted GNAT family acetyltransferase